MKSIIAPSRGWKLILAIPLLVGVGLGLFLMVRPEPPATVILMPLAAAIPPLELPLPDRWIPRSWGWLWRLKYALLGELKAVTFEVKVIDFAGSSESVRANYSLGPSNFEDRNRMRVWLLGDDDVRSLRHDLKQKPGHRVRSSPKVITASGVQSSLQSVETISIDGTPNKVGLMMTLAPRIRQKSTDLTAIITFTECVTNQPADRTKASPAPAISIQTNFAVAARIQIPKENTVLLLDTGPDSRNGRCTGVMISPSFPRSKK